MQQKLAFVALALVCSAFDGPAPTSTVPMSIAAPVTSTPAADAVPPPACTLQYYGGKVIENVVVIQVDWGATVDATISGGVGAFYTAVTNSAYMDWLAEYNTVGVNSAGDGLAGSNQGISRGTFGGKYVITPSVAGTTITDAQIQSELIAQITAGNLPPPSLAADGEVNSIYMFEFPKVIKITRSGSTSCVQFCAYHGTVTYNGKHVPYGVHPDLSNTGCATGCGSSTFFNNSTSVRSHELIEAVTDMEVGYAVTFNRPLAWYAQSGCTANGEIGDICNGQQGTIGAYTVQKEWSNKANACIVTNPTAPAICTGPNTPVGCRACTPADEGYGCNGATPKCETTAGNVKLGQCVACVGNAQCSGATPICGKSATAAQDDVCRACVNSDCSGATPACETSGTFTGQCVQCTGANPTACMGTNGVCDTATDHCVQCLGNGDCVAMDSCHSVACNVGAHTCVQTPLTGTSCSDGDACTLNDTCQAGVCTAGTAKTCTALDQCHTAGTCNPANGACSNPAKADNTTCSDGDSCTMTDTCQAGVCTSGTAKVCTAMDSCHMVGTCNPADGTCSNPASGDGTACTDSNACTTGETCTGGVCGGGTNVTCPAGDECNDAATCSMASGCGAVTPKADGTPCSIGKCMAGVCKAAMVGADMAMVATDDMTSGQSDDMGSGGGGGGGGGGTGGAGGGGGGGKGGCSCDITHDATPPMAPIALLGVLVLALRVRRRRAGHLDNDASIE